jgi:hypothetical protein
MNFALSCYQTPNISTELIDFSQIVQASQRGSEKSFFSL